MSRPELPSAFFTTKLLERVDADFSEVHLAPRPIIDDRAQQYTGKKETEESNQSSGVLLLELVVYFNYCSGGVVGAVGLHRRCGCVLGLPKVWPRFCISGAGFEMVMGGGRYVDICNIYVES